MLFLNRKNIKNVGRQVIQDAVRTAYALVLSDEYNMPDRTHVDDGGNALLLMPCFGSDFFATKVVSVFPHAMKSGQPVVNGVLVLSDNNTGQPIAIMDGAAITTERTGAVGGLAVDLLTSTGIKTAGILGSGVQGLSQARYLLFNRKVDKLWIRSRHRDADERMAATLAEEFPHVEFGFPSSCEALVDACELVIAATTAKKPLFKDDKALVQGKTFISIGSFRPDMQEFPDSVISNADHVYVDTPFAARESGDVCIPLKNGVIRSEKIEHFSDFMKAPLSFERETILFKSVGMALFDLTVASAVYKAALKDNMGQKLDF